MAGKTGEDQTPSFAVDATPFELHLSDDATSDDDATAIGSATKAIARQPTLRRTWPGECPWPQCAFEVSMIYVFCNSH